MIDFGSEGSWSPWGRSDVGAWPWGRGWDQAGEAGTGVSDGLLRPRRGWTFLPEQGGVWGLRAWWSGAQPQQSYQTEQESKAQQWGAGPKPTASRAKITQEVLAAMSAHGCHTKVDAGARADGRAALVQGVAKVDIPNARSSSHGHTVVVCTIAYGWLQAVKIAFLIGAGEAHQGVGLLHTQKDGQQHRQEDPHAGGNRHLSGITQPTSLSAPSEEWPPDAPDPRASAEIAATRKLPGASLPPVLGA